MGSRPCTRYRMFDRFGLLLYIGVTVRPGDRFSEHSGESPWWSQVARVELEHFPDDWAARQAERAAILSERPAYNRAPKVPKSAPPAPPPPEPPPPQPPGGPLSDWR